MSQAASLPASLPACLVAPLLAGQYELSCSCGQGAYICASRVMMELELFCGLSVKGTL